MVAGLSQEQKRALIIADNKLAQNAGWNLQMLASELADLRVAAFDLSIIGFDQKELSGLIGFSNAPLDAMPALPDGDKGEFEEMTFVLHSDQARSVREAISAAKSLGPFDSPNSNGNGNALARICDAFLSSLDDGR
jgi:hypothetical protein